jgi:hypothetical protein
MIIAANKRTARDSVLVAVGQGNHTAREIADATGLVLKTQLHKKSDTLSSHARLFVRTS